MHPHIPGSTGSSPILNELTGAREPLWRAREGEGERDSEAYREQETEIESVRERDVEDSEGE